MTLGGVSVVAGSGSSSATQLTPLSINHWLNTAGSIPPTPPPVGPVIGTMGIGIVSMSTPIVAGVELKPAVIALGDNDVYMPIIFDWYDSDPSATPAPTAIIAGVSGNNTGYIVNASDANKNLWVKAYYTNTQGVASIVYSPVFNVGSLVGNSDTTPPVYQSAAVSPDGLSLIITYDEPLSSTTAATTDFVVNVDSSPVTISSVAASGSAVTLTLAVAIQTSQVVEFSYTQPAGTDAIQDLAGNKAISLPITSATNGSTDTTPPVYQSAAISTNGLSLVLTYDESLSSTTATTSAFVVNVNSAPVTVNAVTATGLEVTLTLAVAIQDGQTVAFAYTQPGGTDAIKDTAGNKAISLTSTSATNNSTVPGGGADNPITGSLTISGNSTVGSVLTVTSNTLDDPDGIASITYDWIGERIGYPVTIFQSTATADPYTIQSSASGFLRLYVRVTIVDINGNTSYYSSNELGPVS
jgi:uncharacterized repeat protein (TIGR02059 family)